MVWAPRWVYSSICLQTGKCPTSGEFFAIYLALMGGFCPEKGARPGDPKEANRFVFSRVLASSCVIGSFLLSSIFLQFLPIFRPSGAISSPSSSALSRCCESVQLSSLHMRQPFVKSDRTGLRSQDSGFRKSCWEFWLFFS